MSCSDNRKDTSSSVYRSLVCGNLVLLRSVSFALLFLSDINANVTLHTVLKLAGSAAITETKYLNCLSSLLTHHRES